MPKRETARLELTKPKREEFKGQRTVFVQIDMYRMFGAYGGIPEMRSGEHMVVIQMDYKRMTEEKRRTISYQPLTQHVVFPFRAVAGHDYELKWEGEKGRPDLKIWIHDKTSKQDATKPTTIGDRMERRL